MLVKYYKSRTINQTKKGRLKSPRLIPIANPPKFLQLESDTVIRNTPNINNIQNLTGITTVKAVALGFDAVKKPKKEDIAGSAPT